MSMLGSRLAAAFVYPRAVSDYVELAFPLHSTREIRAKVVGVRRETHDVTTLSLKPNALWRGHRAGQYVALTAEIDGVRRTRCFSISSAEGAPLEITIKARPDGAVTPALVFGDRLGTVVTLSAAQGEFVLPAELPERMLFLSGGSGITPVMAMLRTLRRSDYRGEIAFVHYARSPRDVIFSSELAQVGAHVITDRGIDDLSSVVPDYASWETWACGPEPMLERIERMIPRVNVERFALPAVANGAAEVSFRRSATRRSGAGSLLVMAEQAGLQPPSGCRMGICHTCTCRKVSGVTRDLQTGQLSTDENVDIRLCVSAAVGPVELDL